MRDGRRKEERTSDRGWLGGWKRKRRAHWGLAGQLLPQGEDMRDTFILTGRVTPESREEETGRVIKEGQTW